MGALGQPQTRKVLVCGVGINDATYSVYRYKGSAGSQKRIWACPFYRTWGTMLGRCYSDKFHEQNPTYVGCTVCDEWLTFSKFKAWMETQDWKDKQLDKDILVPGNKLYSPRTCAFVTPGLNKFVGRGKASHGEWPIGVHWKIGVEAFAATCWDPFQGRRHLGHFSTPEAAHAAWRQCKHELAYQYADMQTDPRVAEALRLRFEPPGGAGYL